MLLAKANDVQVNVTQSEFEQIVQNSIGDVASSSPSEIADWTKSEVDGCNSIDYSGPNPDEEITCDNLGKDLAPLMIPGRGLNSNVSLAAAEIAFARACAAPQNNAKPAFGCMDLGMLYEYEGKPELALAVYQNAEKCQGTLVAEPDVLEIDPDQQVDWTNRERKECLKKEVAILYRMHRYDAERNVATILCNADSEMGCGYLKSLGADVNMQAVEQQQAKLQAANKATAAADYAADAKAKAEANANFSVEMRALHSLPGGSDPNAIVATANQEAGQMIAVGAANDAARTPAAAERNAPQREEVPVPRPETQPAGSPSSGSKVTYAQPSAGTEPPTQTVSACAGFPAFITASSSTFSQEQNQGETLYSGSMIFNIPPGYHGDGAEVDYLAQGTSYAAKHGTVITISQTVSGAANTSAFFILANATHQMTYRASFPTNVPAPFSITLKRDDQQGCGKGSVAGGAGVPQ